jgi:hypothetical protein
MPVRQQAAAARGKGPEEFERKKAILALVPFDLSTEGSKQKFAARGDRTTVARMRTEWRLMSSCCSSIGSKRISLANPNDPYSNALATEDNISGGEVTLALLIPLFPFPGSAVPDGEP